MERLDKWLWLVLIPLVVVEIATAMVEGFTRLFAGGLAILRVWLNRDYSYLRWLKRDLADCHSILELGCGSNSPLLRIGLGPRTDTIEIFEPYVDMHNRKGDYRKCWHGNLLGADLPLKEYDAVVMLDVLEHLPAVEVERVKLFDNMERCARKRVILFTPNGFVENPLVDDDPHQAHVSAWEPEVYRERGYTVHGATGLRWILGVGSLPKYHPYSVMAIIAMTSMRLIYNKPEWAWHSYAVKEVGK